MFCPFGGLAHDLGVWRRKNGEYQNPCCGPGIETSPNKIKPYFGKLWKTQWSLQIHGSWRPFWEGSGPFTKSRPSIFWVIHLSSMMKFPLHLWGSGYDSVSNCPYKIKGKNACFWGTTPWFCKGNCLGYYITLPITWMKSPLYFQPGRPRWPHLPGPKQWQWALPGCRHPLVQPEEKLRPASLRY